MFRIPTCNLNELNNSLLILKKDLITIFEYDGRMLFPILYNRSLSIKSKHDEKSRPHENIYNKIYDALISCNFYLNALSNERCSFEYAANNGADDANKEMMEENVFSSVVDVKKNFQILTEKAWKGFAETNSFCTFVTNICKIVSPQETEEVLYAFKHAIEVYERAATFDVSYPGNAQQILSALDNVKSSTRTMQSYLWMIKTLITHSKPNLSTSVPFR